MHRERVAKRILWGLLLLLVWVMLRSLMVESLVSSASNGNAVAVHRLLVWGWLFGMDANEREPESYCTPLMAAAQAGSEPIVKELLSRGAKVNTVDKTGRTAIIDAAVRGNPAVIKLLSDHGAEVNARMDDGTTALTVATSNGHTDAVRVLVAQGATK